jgi:hypothetical protein
MEKHYVIYTLLALASDKINEILVYAMILMTLENSILNGVSNEKKKEKWYLYEVHSIIKFVQKESKLIISRGEWGISF